MATTLTTFQSRLVGPIGRDDSVADGFITQGVNFACILVALLFEPQELQATGSLTISGSGSSVSLATLTRLRVLKDVYNATSSLKVWSIPYERFNFVVPTETGNVRFYSRDGATLYVKPSPSVSNTLTVHYSQFPSVVASGTDEISFSDKDSLVEAYALAYAMGCLEETEQGQFWQKLGETLMVPESMLLKARKYMEGGPNYGDNKG
jgi:hypothetical protein